MYLRMRNARSRQGMEEKFEQLPEEYSHLYLAIDGELAAVICIEDPLREEAPAGDQQAERRRIYQGGDDDRGQ